MAASRYAFQIQTEVPQSQGTERFSLTVKKALEHRNSATELLGGKRLFVYPNPFVDVIRLQSPESLPEEVQVIIRDLMGQTLMVFDLKPRVQDSFDAGRLTKGLYILELRDSQRNKRIKTMKIVKL